MKRLLIVWLLLSPFSSDAQKQGHPLIDSMLKELSDAREDTNKVKLLSNICFQYHLVNPDSGIIYGKIGLALGEALKWKKGIASVSGNTGINYRDLAQYLQALECYFKSLKLYEEIKDGHGIAAMSGNIGVIFQYQNDCKNALEYELQALKAAVESGDSNMVARELGDIATVYCLEKKYDTALIYDFESLKKYIALGNKRETARTYGNIGYVYDEARNYPKALEYSYMALEALRPYGNTRSIAIKYYNIGDMYLKIAKGAAIVQPGRFVPKGKAALLDNAKIYLDSAMAVSKIIKDVDGIEGDYEDLSLVAALTGNYKVAYEYNLQYNILKDSVFSTENKVKITHAEAVHEIELKDKQIQIDQLEVAKKRNERWLFIAVICLVVIIAVVLINKLKNRQNKLTEEKIQAEHQLEEFRKNILDKNLIIEQVSAEIEKLKAGQQQEINNELITKLEQSILLTDEQWTDFRLLFDKVHRGFFDRLRKKYPELTQAEIRFLALTKLKLTPKEMAAMLGISAVTIRGVRHRLKKKLDFEDDEMIENLAENI